MANPVPSDKLVDLQSNAQTTDEVVNSSALTTTARPTPTNPTGKVLRTLAGINADVELALQRIGVQYSDPITDWTALTEITAFEAHRYPATKGDLYIPTAPLPFTTGATFDSDNWALLQGLTLPAIISDTSIPYIFNTVAEYKASTITFPVGKTIHLNDRDADFTVISGTGTGNNKNIIASDNVSQSVSLSNNKNNPISYGAVENTNIDDVINFMLANNIRIQFPNDSKIYLFGQWTVPVTGTTMNLGGNTLRRDTANFAGGATPFETATFCIFLETNDYVNIFIENGYIDNKHTDDATKYRGFIGISNNGRLIKSRLKNLHFLDDFVGIASSNTSRTPYSMIDVGVRDCSATTVRSEDSTPLTQLEQGWALAVMAHAKDCFIDRNHVSYTWHIGLINQGSSSSQGCRISNNIGVENSDSAVYIYGNDCVANNNIVYRPGKDGVKINTLLGNPSKNCQLLDNKVIGAVGRVKSDATSMFLAQGEGHDLIGNKGVADSLTGHAISFFWGIRAEGKNMLVEGGSIEIDSSLTQCNGVMLGVTGLYDGDYTGSKIADITIDAPNNGLSVQDGSVIDYSMTNNTVHITAIGMFLDTLTIQPKPVFANIIGNKLIGKNSNAILINQNKADRINLTGNQFSGVRQRDHQFNSVGGAVFGNGNQSDNMATLANNTAVGRGVKYLVAPTTGSWNIGEVAASNVEGFRCTTSGTMGALGAVTGSITSGTDQLTVNDASLGIYRGVFIAIAGVTGTKRVLSVDGNVATLDSSADATVASAVVAYSAAVFAAGDAALV